MEKTKTKIPSNASSNNGTNTFLLRFGKNLLDNIPWHLKPLLLILIPPTRHDCWEICSLCNNTTRRSFYVFDWWKSKQGEGEFIEEGHVSCTFIFYLFYFILFHISRFGGHSLLILLFGWGINLNKNQFSNNLFFDILEGKKIAFANLVRNETCESKREKQSLDWNQEWWCHPCVIMMWALLFFFF